MFGKAINLQIGLKSSNFRIQGLSNSSRGMPSQYLSNQGFSAEIVKA